MKKMWTEEEEEIDTVGTFERKRNLIIVYSLMTP